MKSLNEHIGWMNYVRVRGLLSGQGKGELNSDQVSIDDLLVMSRADDQILVTDRVILWRFTPEDGILEDTAIVPFSVLKAIHTGSEWAAAMPTSGDAPVDKNPVTHVWNMALEAATVPVVDTGICHAYSSLYFATSYARLFDLDGAALVIDDNLLTPLHTLGNRVRYMGSAVNSYVVAYVDDEPVTVIMPLRPDPEIESHVERWQWFDATLAALRQAVS